MPQSSNRLTDREILRMSTCPFLSPKVCLCRRNYPSVSARKAWSREAKVRLRWHLEPKGSLTLRQDSTIKVTNMASNLWRTWTHRWIGMALYLRNRGKGRKPVPWSRSSRGTHRERRSTSTWKSRLETSRRSGKTSTRQMYRLMTPLSTVPFRPQFTNL